MFKNKFLSFLIFGFVTFSASFIGSIATITSKEPWYSTLNKSGLNPPDWVFAPVWTTLYLFMTIAIWSAWHKNYKDLNLIYIYLMHLFFNTTWSIVFFVFHNIFAALVNLIIIISFIIVLMIKYYKISNLSFMLMIPYLLWCIYALTLNISLYILN
tara:strand:+ start:901 stop:1368 length:468 start_codon:yes stop_codon:yes gene_type:complete